MRSRLTITLSNRLLSKIDKMIDGVRIRTRSHAIEYLISKSLNSNKPQRALILAGGKGTRLRPITYEIPKPMVPFNDRPLLEHTIEFLRKFGIREIIISIGYLGKKIREYFGNGSRWGVHITYVEENSELGTGGPLKLAEPFLDSTFLVVNGDNLIDIDLNTMFNFHKENNAAATVALTTVDDPSAFGVVQLNGNKIINFVEKPNKKNAPSNLINAGMYIAEPEIIERISNGFVSMEKEVFPKIAKSGKLYGYVFDGYWKDLGTLKSYEEAIKDIKSGKLKLYHS